MEADRKTILLLVGLKGAGKTTLGSLLERRLGIPFLRVEPIYLTAMRNYPHLSGADLEPIGFGAILDAIDELASSTPAICLESTATAGYFPTFLARLRSRYRVLLIRVQVPHEVAVARAQSRDSAGHIPVSDDRLREINRIAAGVDLPWDVTIDNSGSPNGEAAVESIKSVLAANATL